MGQPPTACQFSHFSCNLQETSQNTPLWLGLYPIRQDLTASSILLLNTDSAVEPLSLALSGILALWKFDWLIDWEIRLWVLLTPCLFGYAVWGHVEEHSKGGGRTKEREKNMMVDILLDFRQILAKPFRNEHQKKFSLSFVFRIFGSFWPRAKKQERTCFELYFLFSSGLKLARQGL